MPEPPIPQGKIAPFEDKVTEWVGRPELKPKKNVRKTKTQASSVVSTQK